MKEILTKSFSLTTDPAVITMVDGFVLIIIPELTLVAVVLCHLDATTSTMLTGWLSFFTLHAHHLLGFMSNNIVITCFIVTKPTRKNDPTAIGYQFDFATIMLASQDIIGFILMTC